MDNSGKKLSKIFINSLISEKESLNIQNYLMNSDIKWIFSENTVSNKFIPNYNFLENLVDSWQLVNLVLANNEIYDEKTFNVIRPIIDKFIEHQKIKDFYIDKIKINTLFQKENYKNCYYNTPHQDCQVENFRTLLYYVNDSDGDTIFFNDDDVDINSKINLKIEEKITPKRGSVVVFNSNQYHASSNPILNKRRLVINIVFKSY